MSEIWNNLSPVEETGSNDADSPTGDEADVEVVSKATDKANGYLASLL